MAKKSKKRINTVYSTDPDYDYYFEDEQEAIEDLPAHQQKLRVMIDRKKRKGKEVTLVTGYVGSDEKLKELGKLLKSKCGVGGSVKDGEIIVQGSFKEKVVALLKAEGFKNTKAVGG